MLPRKSFSRIYIADAHTDFMSILAWTLKILITGGSVEMGHWLRALAALPEGPVSSLQEHEAHM